jgi:hypothetical protein
MTPQQMLERAGRALNPTADDWRARFAHELGMSPNSMRQLLTGHLTVRRDHLDSVLRLLAERRVGIEQAEAELRQWILKREE